MFLTWKKSAIFSCPFKYLWIEKIEKNDYSIYSLVLGFCLAIKVGTYFWRDPAGEIVVGYTSSDNKCHYFFPRIRLDSSCKFHEQLRPISFEEGYSDLKEKIRQDLVKEFKKDNMSSFSLLIGNEDKKIKEERVLNLMAILKQKNWRNK